ncbi:caspase domain-containing protein [Kitasatospora sp. NPDC006697]|uniref:caspase family protein n=1 Tax=Kitasatospora sp. NPDC006697 TaxID=3364020 RepID=UPI003680EF37
MSWPPRAADPERSRAVLVSVSAFRDPGLDPLPQAMASVDELADALAGPGGPLRWERITRIHDPRSADEVLRPLRAAAADSPDLLLLYYAGHGVPAGDRLHLALPDTDQDAVPTTALPVQQVLDLLQQAPVQHRLAWLDCCFAGLALDLPGAGDVNLLAAADRTRKALSPPGDRTTLFAGAVLELLREGVPDGPERLTLPLLHRRVEVTLGQVPPGMPRRTQAPDPCHRLTHTSADLALAPNPAHGTAHTADGLRARARFAVRTARSGRPGRRAQAVALFTELVADAERHLGAEHPVTGDLRQALTWSRWWAEGKG